MSSAIRSFRILTLMGISVATLAAVSACSAVNSEPAAVLTPPSTPWSAALSAAGTLTAITTSFSVPLSYRVPSGQTVSTGHLAIEYISLPCLDYDGGAKIVVDSGPSLTALNSSAIILPPLQGQLASLVKIYFSAGDTFHVEWSTGSSEPNSCNVTLFGELMPN